MSFCPFQETLALYLAVMSPWAPLGYDNFSDLPCLFLMTFTVSGVLLRDLYRMSFNLGLPGIFLMVRQRLLDSLGGRPKK